MLMFLFPGESERDERGARPGGGESETVGSVR